MRKEEAVVYCGHKKGETNRPSSPLCFLMINERL